MTNNYIEREREVKREGVRVEGSELRVSVPSCLPHFPAINTRGLIAIGIKAGEHSPCVQKWEQAVASK